MGHLKTFFVAWGEGGGGGQEFILMNQSLRACLEGGMLKIIYMTCSFYSALVIIYKIT